MRIFIFLPPLPRMSGGLAVLMRVGKQLAGGGFEVHFVARQRAPWLEPCEKEEQCSDLLPGLVLWPGGSEFVPSGSLLQADDIWLTPEGWPHALLPGLRAGCRTVIYVQNWAYLLSEWPAGLEPAALPVHFMAVSRPVAWHVSEVTGKTPVLLRPGIDVKLFSPLTEKKRARAERFSVAWMPRKNKALARQIREIVTARRAQRGLPQPDWVEIHNMTPMEVANTLRRCDIFLATGFPEGCPLPPLEALACGCVGVGFSGFGGWDYMRLPGISDVPDAPGILPDWLPRAVRAGADPRPGNGFWVSDGDVIGAALALDQALAALEDDDTRAVLRQAGQLTVSEYSLAAQERRVLEMGELARRGLWFV